MARDWDDSEPYGPWQNLPSTQTPVPAEWFTAVDEQMEDLADGSTGRVKVLEQKLPAGQVPVTLPEGTTAAVGTLPAVVDASPLTHAYVEYFKVLAAQLDPLIVGTITRNANGAATGAGVVWPDGRPGVYTATTLSTAFPGAVDAYTITYDAPGSDPDLTFTQPAVTRDSTTGAVTARPAVTVA